MTDLIANIVALIGATGQGKSATFKSWLQEDKPARLMLWDTMNEYGEHGVLCNSLEDVVRATAAESFAIRYVARGDVDQLWQKFEVFCRIAYERGSVTLGCEELNTVTRANGGPASWSDCTLRGRHKKLCIVGLSQRPALVDKNFFSNATRIRCFRLNFDDDVATMAGVLGVDKDRVRTLLPLQFLERDMASGEVTGGGLFGTPAPATAHLAEVPRRQPAANGSRAPRRPTAPPAKKTSAKKRKKRR